MLSTVKSGFVQSPITEKVKTWFLLTGSLPFKCISILRSFICPAAIFSGCRDLLALQKFRSSEAGHCVAGCYLEKCGKPSEGEDDPHLLGDG